MRGKHRTGSLRVAAANASASASAVKPSALREKHRRGVGPVDAGTAISRTVGGGGRVAACSRF